MSENAKQKLKVWESIETKQKMAIKMCCEIGSITESSSSHHFAVGGQTEYFRELLSELTDEEMVEYMQEVVLQYISDSDLAELLKMLARFEPISEAIVGRIVDAQVKQGKLLESAGEYMEVYDD